MIKSTARLTDLSKPRDTGQGKEFGLAEAVIHALHIVWTDEKNNDIFIQTVHVRMSTSYVILRWIKVCVR